MAEIELVFSKVNSLGMFLMSHLLKLICRVRLTVFSVSNVSLSVFWLLARPCLIRCILWALWDCCTAFPEILLAFQAQGCGSCVWKCLCIAKHRWTGLHWGAVLASIKLVEFHRRVRYTNAAAWWHLRATPRCIFRDILSRSCSFSSSFCSYSFSLLIGMLFCYPVVNSESLAVTRPIVKFYSLNGGGLLCVFRVKLIFEAIRRFKYPTTRNLRDGIHAKSTWTCSCLEVEMQTETLKAEPVLITLGFCTREAAAPSWLLRSLEPWVWQGMALPWNNSARRGRHLRNPQVQRLLLMAGLTSARVELVPDPVVFGASPRLGLPAVSGVQCAHRGPAWQRSSVIESKLRGGQGAKLGPVE